MPALPSLLLVSALLHAQPAAPANRPAPADGRAPTTAPAATQPTHDREPWVFRCVLDNNPRMLVINLGQNWWMAFDTVTCSIYKLWQGEIELTGAVYDTKHGPQPKAKGRFVIDGRPPLKLEPYPGNKNWTPAQKPHGIQPIGPSQWRGYELNEDGVTLKWDAGPYQLSLKPINQFDHIDFILTVVRKAEAVAKNEVADELPTIYLDDAFREVVWPPVLNFAEESIVQRRPTFQIDLTPSMSNTKEPAE